MQITTTLALLKEHGACGQKPSSGEGYDKLRQHIGLKYPKRKEISLTTILESNSLADTLWSFRAVPVEQYDYAGKVLSLFIADCLEIIVKDFDEKFDKEFPKISKMLKAAPETIRRYWRGEIGRKEVEATLKELDRADLADRAYRADLADLAYRANRADRANLA